MVHYLSPVLRLGLGSVRVRLGFQLDFWLEVRGSIRGFLSNFQAQDWVRGFVLEVLEVLETV